MIHCHEVQKNVGNRAVFTDLTLFLPKASYTLLCGDRQSGKTTLVQMLMAYERPDQGTLTVDGIDVGNIPDSRIPYLRRQIGLIAEKPALLEDSTVIENIAVPLQLAGFDKRALEPRLVAMLESSGLQHHQNTKVNQLTAPIRQLVSTARAVIHKPPVVIADEPLHNLDIETADAVMALLNQAHKAGATLLVTCQSAQQLLAATPGANTLMLKAGTVINNEQRNIEQDTID